MLRSLLLFALLVLPVTVASAEEQKPVLDESSPDAVLRACLDRLTKNDFEGYIALLADEEIRFQSGVLILYGSMTQPESLLQMQEFNPSSYLLVRSINELITNSLGPGMTDELPKIRQELLSLSSYTTTYNSQTGQMSEITNPTFRTVCVRAARALRDPSRFLMQALKVLSSPTFAVKDGKKVQTADDGWSVTIAVLPHITWDLYLRGSYAVAVVKLPAFDPKSTAQSPEPVKTPSEESPSVPDAVTPSEPRITFELTRQGQQWRITRLLPITSQSSL